MRNRRCASVGLPFFEGGKVCSDEQCDALLNADVMLCTIPFLKKSEKVC